MKLVEVVPPSADAALDVVSVAQMKEHLAIIHDERNAAITDAIRDAVAYFDGPYGVLNRSVLQRTYVAHFDAFPCRNERLRIPYPPIREITAFMYRDTAGDMVDLDPDAFQFQDEDMGGYLTSLGSTGAWPSYGSYPGGLQIEFTVGYPADAVPRQLRRGVKLMAAHYLRNTDATESTNAKTRVNHRIEFGVDSVINLLRVPLPLGDA